MSAASQQDCLVVIDMQHVFADVDSPWGAPRYAEAAAGVRRLLPAFAGRTVFTRFVAPGTPRGAWVDYYRDWPFALTPPDHPQYDLTEPFRGTDDPVVTATSFGKWGTGLQTAIGDATGIVLAGVSTDCCVLSTALAAADAGVRVRVVADACAGASDADHSRALDAMRLYGPLIEIVETGLFDSDRTVTVSA